MHEYMHAYIHAYIHIYIHTHTHIYTYIQTYIHTCIHTFIYNYTYTSNTVITAMYETNQTIRSSHHRRTTSHTKAKETTTQIERATYQDLHVYGFIPGVTDGVISDILQFSDFSHNKCKNNDVDLSEKRILSLTIIIVY